jgi:hypothetical protein
MIPIGFVFEKLVSLKETVGSFMGSKSEGTNGEGKPMVCDSLWCRFIDSLNQLIKPGLLLGVIILFWWAAVDPANFSKFGKATNEMPQEMWYMVISIIGFWFGHHTVKTFRKGGDNPIAVADDDADENGDGVPDSTQDEHDTVLSQINDNPSLAAWKKARDSNKAG